MAVRREQLATRHVPASLTAGMLAITALGQSLFWVGNVRDQAAAHGGSALGTTSWLLGTVAFLSVTAGQSARTTSRMLRRGTLRQKLESLANSIVLTLSCLFGVFTLVLHFRAGIHWDDLDTLTAGVIIAAYAMYASCAVARKPRQTMMNEAAVGIIAILCRGVPRIILSLCALAGQGLAMGWLTVAGGQIVALSRTCNARVSYSYDAKATLWPFRTEAWGNLFTQSLLLGAWVVVSFST